MPVPASVTFKTVHGQILNLDSSGTPAYGYITFTCPYVIRDVNDNIVFQKTSINVTLDANGEFTVQLAATDDPDLDPTAWVWQVFLHTNVSQETFYLPVPLAAVEPIEFSDAVTTSTTAVPAALFNAYTKAETDLLLGLKVAKAGDTMTGSLTMASPAGITVSDTGVLADTYSGVSGDVMRLLATGLSTCITSGGDIAVNAGDNTKLDISATAGWIIDYASTAQISPTNPKITYVSIPAQVALSPLVGIPTGVTWWMINSAGAIIRQTTKPTPQERRDNLVIGATAQVANVIIVDQSLPVTPSQPLNQLVDLMDSLGPFSTQGNVLSPNGVNLTFQKSSGDVFARAFSQIPHYQDPHTAHLAAQAPVNFRHITAIPGGAGPLTTILDVANYDPNAAGIITPIPGGPNTAANFRVWGFANNTVNDQIIVQYPQRIYATLTDARDALSAGVFVPSPTATAAGALLGWISVIKSATDLSSPTQAVFSKASKFATP